MVRWYDGGGDSVVIMVERGRYRNIHMYVMCTTCTDGLRSLSCQSLMNNYLKVPPSLVMPKSKIYRLLFFETILQVYIMYTIYLSLCVLECWCCSLLL
jgi:hypothetical protein